MPEYNVAEKKEKMQGKERRIKIENSRYNKWYKRIKGVSPPKYMKNSWSEGDGER